MDTMIMERPKIARKSAGCVCPTPPPLPAVEATSGIPWYMTVEEVYAELDQAEREFEAGLGITHEEFLKEIATWKSAGRPNCRRNPATLITEIEIQEINHFDCH
jgi:hypothetical protein